MFIILLDSLNDRTCDTKIHQYKIKQGHKDYGLVSLF